MKITGDGTRTGKRLNVVNFGFTILEEGEAAYSATENHCIAIIKEQEFYDSLKPALQDIIEEVRTATKLTISGIACSIEYYMGGDWKFLAMVTGIDSSSCEYTYIWCRCPALDRHITDESWSISDPSLGAWLIEENITIVSSSRAAKQFNVSHRPLFPKIPLTHVVVDNLHVTSRDFRGFVLDREAVQ